MRPVIARTAAPEADAAPAGLLSPDEASLLAGYTLPKRRKDWLAGRMAAKQAVRACLKDAGWDLSDDRIEVLKDESGAPLLRLPEGTPRPAISISHSRAGGAAAADLSGRPVGIDLEAVAPRARSFVETVLHPDERADEPDAREVTRLWTLKEAVAKLLGTGLSIGMWDIRFVGPERKLSFHGKALERWTELGRPAIVHESRFEGDDVLSLAYTALPSGGKNA
ncbi:MAG TPA: 4'-phosphopantetheinyl transferase superfamily protein [Elusimicrobiota bacterium]|jgi:4'-phosphopantetheinyl transferase|nr:4'-phosphopantetheinyl transferase superfamily protein [Elusimicrobiota bacterium]